MNHSDTEPTPDLDPRLRRYSRQVLFTPFGERGQAGLRTAHVTVVGCGALGTVIANTLVRAGVGALRIIDRDFIELDNLQRQVLFDEQDISDNLPKAEAAARKLRRVNSAVEVEGVVDDVNPSNVSSLLEDTDLILDGNDNFETRFLVNDFAVKHDLPWIYGACIGSEGLVLPIIPHETPCLRCIWEDAPPAGMSPTCDTAGVLAPIVNIVASLQALEAMKILGGHLDQVKRELQTIDVWAGTYRGMSMQAAYEQGDCPCCKHATFDFLSGEHTSTTTTLCGRNAVQVLPPIGSRVDFRQIAERIHAAGVKRNEFMLRFRAADFDVTLFPDGRAIIKGTSDPAAARSFYAKYIGA